MGEFRKNLLQVQKNADNRKFKCDVALLSVFFVVMPLHAPYPRHQGWSGCSVPGARGDERMPRCLTPKMSFSNSIPQNTLSENWSLWNLKGQATVAGFGVKVDGNLQQLVFQVSWNMNWLYVVVLHLRSTEALPLSSSAMAMESEPSRPNTSDQKCKTCWIAWVLHRGILKTTFDHPEWFKPSLQQVRCPLRIPTGWPGSWRKKETNTPSQGHSAAGWRIHIYEWWKNLWGESGQFVRQGI